MRTVIKSAYFRVLVALGMALALSASGGARAQAPPTAQPQPATQVEVQQPQAQSAWVKLCRKTALSAEQGQPPKETNICSTIQERFDNKSARFIASVAVRQQEGQPNKTVSVVVPIGIDLRKPLQAKVDPAKPLKLDYVRCTHFGCIADGQVTPDLLKALRSGQQITIEVVGGKFTFSLPLAGFGAIDDGAAFDGKKYAEARKGMINAIKARRASEIQRAVQDADKQKQQPTQPKP